MQSEKIKKGVDISFYQKTVNFELMASRGVERVYIRAAYGTRQDIRFAENWGRSQGVIPERGVYLYFLASLDPEAQAENLFRIVEGAGGELPDQPAALDLEYNNIDGAVNSPARFRDYPLRVMRCLEKIGELFNRRPIIYSNPSFIKSNLKLPEFASYGLWIANYSEIAPRVPLPWAPGFQVGWQYSAHNSMGKWYGVESAAIDLDLWYE